jgi:hypothetical protein
MLLHSALADTWSSSGNVSQVPPPARKLLEAYSRAYRSIDEKERAEPYWREKCGYLANLFDTCRRKRFTYKRQYFKTSAQAANDTAQLYFPSGYRDRFVDLTGVGGSRQRFADYQSERREAGRVDERRLFRKKLPALLGGLSLIPLCIGFALFGMARRIGTSLKRYELDDSESPRFSWRLVG